MGVTKTHSKMKFKNFSIMVAKLRLLLRLHKDGVSQRQLAKRLSLSRTSINAYLKRFLASGKSLKELEELDDSSLLKLSQGEIYRQEPDARFSILEPLLPHYASESKRPKVTIQLLWEEYFQRFRDDAYSYTTFKYHVNEYIKTHSYSYHNSHKPGDVLQVDFAGDHLYITDRDSGDKIPVEILCCTLPCSSYSFVYALPDACMENLFGALSKCLSYINGVPRRILSDNMKQWVKRREKNEPIFTDAAIEFGVHYATAIEATGVRSPKHKASVESAVHHIYNRIYAKVRDEVFFSINELNSRILDLLVEFNDRKMKNKEYSRSEFFELNEKASLAPLPDMEFTLKYSKQTKVKSNYHIFINTHQYSVPYEYVNQTVSIIYDKDTVEIYDTSYSRIALHKRSFNKYGYSTIAEHMPPNHLAYEFHKNQKNAAYYLYRAGKIDDNVANVLQMVFDNAACIEQAYNSCEAILQLHKLDPESFVNSCKYAKENLKTVNYKIIRQIMKNKAYIDPLSSLLDFQITHSNLRGKEEFLN